MRYPVARSRIERGGCVHSGGRDAERTRLTLRTRSTTLASGLAVLLGLGLPLWAAAYDDRTRDGEETERCVDGAFPATGQLAPATADTAGGYDTTLRDDGTAQAGGR